MNEKQSMLIVIGMQTMKLAVLQDQVTVLTEENKKLKAKEEKKPKS